MSARAMYCGQSRRSPRTVANGTRGPHRGQGRREMKRGVNSLRQALRPQTSPIDTHSRGSCHCPIDRNQSLPMLTRRHAERPRHRSLLSGRMDLSKEEICKAMELPRTTYTPLEKGTSATADQPAQGRGEPGYQPRRTPKAAHGSHHSHRHHRHSVSWSRSIRASVGAVDGENSLRQRVNWFQRRAFAGSYSPLQNAEILPSMSLTSSAKWSFR